MPDVSSERLVEPFVGERFVATDRMEMLIAPPYDVISDEQRVAFASQDDHNIVHLILPEGAEDKYDRAAAVLGEWRGSGVFASDSEPSVYVLRQEFQVPSAPPRVRTGLIGAVAVESYSAGRVRPHEQTHAGPKADRLALLRATNTVLDALLLLSRDASGALAEALARASTGAPAWTAKLQGVTITLWRLGGRAAADLAALAGAEPLYVADGHHRYETAVRYREERWDASRTLGLIVPLGDPGLVVLPTHRLIHGQRVNVDQVVKDLREWFRLHELPPDVSYVESLLALRERGTACIVIHPGGNALALLMKQDIALADLPFAEEPSVASLDVARVDGLVVDALRAGAGDGASVSYSASADEVIDTVLRGDAVAGVLLNPASVEQVLRVADARAAMPQKATYFTPKVPSGAVLLNLGA